MLIKKKKFNAGYVQYIIDKHLQLLVDYVYEKKGINVAAIQILRQEIYNNNINEEAHEKWLDDCTEDYFCANFKEMVDKIIEQDYTQMLYFYYYSEEKKLTKRLVDGINEFNERKFFIVR